MHDYRERCVLDGERDEAGSRVNIRRSERERKETDERYLRGMPKMTGESSFGPPFEGAETETAGILLWDDMSVGELALRMGIGLW